MAWTAPRTWVTGEVVTSSIMNTHIRDNFLGMPNWAAAGPLSPGAQGGNAESFAGLAFYFTPRRTGNVLLIATFQGACSTTNTNWTAYLLTGAPGDTAPPKNGSIGGSARIGGPVSGDPYSAQGQASVAIHAVKAGLTVGTRYWFDLSVSGTSTPTLSNIYLTAIEL